MSLSFHTSYNFHPDALRGFSQETNIQKKLTFMKLLAAQLVAMLIASAMIVRKSVENLVGYSGLAERLVPLRATLGCYAANSQRVA